MTATEKKCVARGAPSYFLGGGGQKNLEPIF